MSRHCLRSAETSTTPSPHKRRGVLAEPFLEFGVLLEFRHLDAVDGRPGLADLPDFIGAHLANPEYAMPLQTGMREIDGTLIQRPVDVAAADQDEIDEVAREFQQQAVRRIVLPVSEPRVGKPHAVAIPETQLHGRRTGRGVPAGNRTLRTKPRLPRPPPRFAAKTWRSRTHGTFVAIAPDVWCHRAWSTPHSYIPSLSTPGCMNSRRCPDTAGPPANASCFFSQPRKRGCCCVFSEISVADNGTSGRPIAFSSSFLSSVNIWACSFPRVRAT